MKLITAESVRDRFGVGVGLNLSSGAPLTPFAANPNDTNGGEIPEAPCGSGIQTIGGFKTRTPFLKYVDLQASYQLGLGGNRHITLLADTFNLFNTQAVTMYDQWTELTGPLPNRFRRADHAGSCWSPEAVSTATPDSPRSACGLLEEIPQTRGGRSAIAAATTATGGCGTAQSPHLPKYSLDPIPRRSLRPQTGEVT